MMAGRLFKNSQGAIVVEVLWNNLSYSERVIIGEQFGKTPADTDFDSDFEIHGNRVDSVVLAVGQILLKGKEVKTIDVESAVVGEAKPGGDPG